MKCTWSFIETSHSNLPGDGIVGAVKRLTSIASLHRTTNNHILTASAMFNFWQIKITEISFYYISKESNIIIQSEMEQRYTTAKNITKHL